MSINQTQVISVFQYGCNPFKMKAGWTGVQIPSPPPERTFPSDP